MANIIEIIESRSRTKQLQGKLTGKRVYSVSIDESTEDEDDVDTIVEATAPATWGTMLFTEVSQKYLGGGLYEAEASYSTEEPKEEKQAGETAFSFDTTGGKYKTTQSIQTVSSYAPAGQVAPNFKGAVGVSKDSIEGIEVPVPEFKLTATKMISTANLTDAYIRDLRQTTGCVNSAPYIITLDGVLLSFEAGELKFDGVKGSRKDSTKWELVFEFSHSMNVSSSSGDPITIGDITVTEKRGWDYLWIYYTETKDGPSNTLVQTPRAAYVEQVLRYRDFSAYLRIGTLG